MNPNEWMDWERRFRRQKRNAFLAALVLWALIIVAIGLVVVAVGFILAIYG